jgi:hypothetical protein
MKYSIIIFLLCLIASTGTVEAADRAGWERKHVEIRATTADGCAPGQAKMDYSLREYASSDAVNPQGLRVKVQVIPIEGGSVLRETEWVSGQIVTPTFCLNPVTERPRPLVEADDNALYRPYWGGAWYSVDSRQREVGYYTRGYVHLQRKDLPATLDQLSPVNTFVRTSAPAFVIRTNDISRLYGATAFDSTRIFVHHNNLRVAKVVIGHGGGAGTRSFNLGQFPDGLYRWNSLLQLNGRAGATNLTSVPGVYSFTRTLVPGSTISDSTEFFIDGTAPTATANLVAGTSTERTEAIVTLNARDIGSGLREMRLVMTPISGPGGAATVTIPFAVGAGLIGGPKDAQQATWRATLRPGTAYRYVATAIDVAGNVVNTAARTFTAPTLTPDLAFQNFFIRSTCTPESVNFVPNAPCPQSTVALAFRNTSNGVINRGVNIPYRVEYRYPGNDSGTWTEVYRGNYAGGLEAQSASPVFNVIVNRAMRGTGQLRALVNMAPQTNNAIGETEFSNNTSPHRTIVFATTPPKLTLTTDRGTVRSGQTVTLTYNIESPQPFTCELRGNGTPTVIRHEGGDTTGSIQTAPITSTQKFTLSCVSDMGGDPTEQNITVEVIPFIDEV